MTKMSENPEALIDFALSHIPVRKYINIIDIDQRFIDQRFYKCLYIIFILYYIGGGKRGTNQKRRMKLRMDLKRVSIIFHII